MPIGEIGLGAVLKMSTTVGSTATMVSAIGVRSITGPDGTADTLDVTTMDSSSEGIFRLFKKGLIDPGDITLDLIFSSTDASQQGIAGAYASSSPVDFHIFLPDSTTQPAEMTVYVTGMGQALAVDDLISRSVTAKVTGDPNYRAT